MIIMCHCRFISFNKCPTLLEDVSNEEDYACVGTGDIWELCAFSSGLL